MIVDFANQTSQQAYFHITQTLVPRPIAWVLTRNPLGGLNVAPFSYFTPVSSAPPLLMISVGKKPSGEKKDTLANIEQNPRFVVHIASVEHLAELNASAETLPRTTSEIEKLGIATVEFPDWPLPRIASCGIAVGCSLFEVQQIGATAQTLIFGRMEKLFIADELCNRDGQGRLKVDIAALAPLARLGASEYLQPGKIVSLKRPS